MELQLLLGKVTLGPNYLSMLIVSQQSINLESLASMGALCCAHVKYQVLPADFWMKLVLWRLHAVAAGNAHCGGPCQGSATHSA